MGDGHDDPIRVGVIVKEFPPDSIGGLQTQTKRMCRALSEHGVEVTVFTKKYRAHSDDASLPFEIRRIPHLSWSPAISDLVFLIGCLWSVFRHRRRLDVLQCMTIYPIGYLGLLAHRIARLPYFAWIRGNDFYEMRHVWWKRRMIRAVLDDTLVMTQGADIESDVRAEFPALNARMGIIGNGVDPPEDPVVEFSNTILFVGRLAPKKGVGNLIEAMDHVEGEAHLQIVGDGECRHELEKLAAATSQSVEFTGSVPPEDVDEYYRRAGVFVLPSLEGEGMPNAVLEAMAHGLPVVVTESGALSNIIEDGTNGVVVPMNDPVALGTSIDRVLADRDLQSEVGEQARQYVRDHHSWDHISRKVIELYCDLMGEQR